MIKKINGKLEITFSISSDASIGDIYMMKKHLILTLFYLMVLLRAQAQPNIGQSPATAGNSDITEFIDNWHQAAARADFNDFFDAMADSSIYIGTDATERWTKPEFITYAKPLF